jgi:hypothetical protein
MKTSTKSAKKATGRMIENTVTTALIARRIAEGATPHAREQTDRHSAGDVAPDYWPFANTSEAVPTISGSAACATREFLPG